MRCVGFIAGCDASLCRSSVGTVGMGHERRAITSQDSQVTALYLDDVPVHVNLISRE